MYDRNCSPVSMDDVKEVNDAPENASSVTEAQTCYDDHNYCRPGVRSNQDSSEESEDSLTVGHGVEHFADIFSYDEREASELFLNNASVIISWDPEILHFYNVGSPDSTTSSSSEEEKSDSSSSSDSSPDERSDDKIKREACIEMHLFISDDLSYLNNLMRSHEFENGNLAGQYESCRNKAEEEKKKDEDKGKK